MTERCVLWEKTKDLAQERGFEMSQKCPMDSVCTGERCVFISSDGVNPQQQVEKFYKKLEKHEEIYHATS